MLKKLKIPVEEFTSPAAIIIQEETKIPEILSQMREHGCRHIPVVKNTQIVGIISERDVYKKCYEKSDSAASLIASDIMNRDVYRVQSGTNIDKVVFNMSDKKIGSAIVENSEDDSYGIFTLTDALNALVEIIRNEI